MPDPTFKIVYPSTVDDDYKKYFFLYRVKQLLIEEHNIQGSKYKNKEITKAEWLNYRFDRFDPIFDLLTSEILMLRSKAKVYDWKITLDKVIVKG